MAGGAAPTIVRLLIVIRQTSHMREEGRRPQGLLFNSTLSLNKKLYLTLLLSSLFSLLNSAGVNYLRLVFTIFNINITSVPTSSNEMFEAKVQIIFFSS